MRNKPKLSARLKGRAADLAADLLALSLRFGGKNTYRDVVNALWERQPIFSDADIHLDVPSYRAADPAERPLIERIFAFYKRAKQGERDVDPIFLPAGGWKKVVEAAFGNLIKGYETDDIQPFHYFLANFGNWEVPTGIEESSEHWKAKESARKRHYLEQIEMAQLIHWWQTYESLGRDLSVLTTPRHGNFTGIRVNGHVILPNSVFSDFYARQLAGFLHGQPDPIVAELGGGYGRLCYFLTREIPTMHYVGFDLPEGLCYAAYYLMSAFPDKKFLLYGEADWQQVSFKDYDFVLLPAYEIGKQPNDSIDLFLNENSLGAMSPAACAMFVKEICRTSLRFWHRNHEVRRNPFEDGKPSLVNAEYPVPMDRFRLLVRDHDISRIVGHDRSRIKNDMVWYYYERA
ncbi:MAG: putative sugar O-methyltransferase [Planctomycetales bacterium]|nr:putative sugar O-methyltransferase [Planctomycetales bacterium]